MQLLGGYEGAQVGEHVQGAARVAGRQQQLQRRLRRRDGVQLLQLRRHVPQVLTPRRQSLGAQGSGPVSTSGMHPRR